MHGIAWNLITSVCYLRLLAVGCQQFLGIPSDSMDFLAFQRVPWNSFESNAIPWASMEYYGMPSTSMEIYRFLWISMELYGVLWNPIGGLWRPLRKPWLTTMNHSLMARNFQWILQYSLGIHCSSRNSMDWYAWNSTDWWKRLKTLKFFFAAARC